MTALDEICGCTPGPDGQKPCHGCKRTVGFDRDGDCRNCYARRDRYQCPKPRYVQVGKFIIPTTPLDIDTPEDRITTMPSDIDRYDSASSRIARDAGKIKIREMTRVQRRFALEPHFTLIWVSNWIISAILFVLGIWSNGLGFEFAMTALVFAGTGGAAAIAKGIHQETNVKLEGVIEQYVRTRGR